MTQSIDGLLPRGNDPLDESCESHGSYVSHVVMGRRSRCPQCVRIEADKQMREFQAEQRRQMVAGMLSNTGAPKKFASLTPKVGGERETRWANSIVAGQATGPLVLVGEVGTGKSHKACEILLALIGKMAVPGRYVSAAEYCRMSRSTWNKASEESEQQVLHRYSRVPLLVLDDLGAGKTADAELIQDLICDRYDAGLLPRTIISSNVSAPNFDSKFGERVADRIREGATLIEMLGESLRRPAA